MTGQGGEPPHDLAAERIVLGSMMTAAGAIDAIAPVIASADDFYRPAHQLVHAAIVDLHSRGGETGAVAVHDELRRRRQLGKVGGGAYLHTLAAEATTPKGAAYHASIVREVAARRRLTELVATLGQRAADPAVSPEDLQALARQLADAVPGEARHGEAPAARRIVLTPASDIVPEPVVWAWEDDSGGRIPAGSFGLFAGREGTGKSSFLIWLAAQLTTGMLPGAHKGKPQSVIYVAVEDSWKYTIVPRLIAAGADLTRIYRAEVTTIEGDTVTLSLPADIGLLGDAIREHGVALVAVDPLMSAISETLDTHVNRHVRQALDPLVRMADETGTMLGGIAHFNKSSGTDGSSLITGSGAFKDVARYVFAFASDEEDGAKVITQTKNSLGRSDLPSLAYRIIEATVETPKGDARVGRFVLDGHADRTVQDILSAQGSEERSEKARAEEYLRAVLSGGPRLTKEVEDEAQNAHQIAKRTLERARKELRVPARKIGADWYISLPEHKGDLDEFTPPEKPKTAPPAKTAKSAKSSSPGRVGGVGGVDRKKGATVVPLRPAGEPDDAS